MKSRLAPDILTRLRQAFVVGPGLILAATGFLGLLAFAQGELSPDQAVHTLFDNLLALTLAGLLWGGMYVLFGTQEKPTTTSTTWHVSWPTILVSAYLGFLCGAGLYMLAGAGLYPRLGLATEVVPSTASLGQLGLRGGLEGLLWGGLIGLMISKLDSRATHFTRRGIALYLVFYIILSALFALGLLLIVYLKVPWACLSPITLLFFILLELPSSNK